MARFSRLDVLNTMLEVRLVPLYFQKDLETNKQIINACADGGARVIEFTNRDDHAFEIFSDLDKHFAKNRPDLILGAGSVVDSGTASLYINCGANFIVSPNFDAEIARICNRRKIPYFPGCATVKEIAIAEEAGVEVVKFFPSEASGGPEFVKAALAPCPWTRIMPTGISNISKERIEAWFKAGVCCLGVGSKLIPGNIAQTKDFEGITRLVTQLMEWMHKN